MEDASPTPAPKPATIVAPPPPLPDLNEVYTQMHRKMYRESAHYRRQFDRDRRLYFRDNPMHATKTPGFRPPTPGVAKPGRNEPCYCKSGKKFKHCCGAAV